MLFENGRMNQEFPYVIAAIIASSNWCRRSLGRWWSYKATKFFLFFFLHDRDVERLKRHKLEKYFAADAGVARVSAIWSSNFALASDLIALSKYPLSVLRNSSRPNLFKQLDRFLDYQSQIAKFELKSIL